MAKAFECEIRYKVEGIEGFKEKLRSLNAKLRYNYQFIDYYFKPRFGDWNCFEKTLRIRHKPEMSTKILFDRIETISLDGIKFKRSVFPTGKLMIYSGELAFCKDLLNSLGFEEWIKINKQNAGLWEIPNHNIKIALENIEGFGWSLELEFEGEDIDKAAGDISKAINVLGLDKELVSFEPISITYAKSKQLL